MPRTRKPATPTQSAAEATIDWFKTADADVSACDDWDIKSALMQEAVLGLLAAGKAVMFGRSYDGASISVTIYDGDSKSRKWVSDSIEFDDLMAVVCQRLQQMEKKQEKPQLRAVAK